MCLKPDYYPISKLSKWIIKCKKWLLTSSHQNLESKLKWASSHVTSTWVSAAPLAAPMVNWWIQFCCEWYFPRESIWDSFENIKMLNLEVFLLLLKVVLVGFHVCPNTLQNLVVPDLDQNKHRTQRSRSKHVTADWPTEVCLLSAAPYVPSRRSGSVFTWLYYF